MPGGGESSHPRIDRDNASNGRTSAGDYPGAMRAVFTFRTAWLGVLSWFVPLVASFAFFDRHGQLLIERPLFKSIMVVVGGGIGAWFLAAAFRRITPSWRTGVALGAYWLAINLILDLAVLVPFTKMPLALYFSDIGLRYLLIPIIAWAMGVVGARAAAP